MPETKFDTHTDMQNRETAIAMQRVYKDATIPEPSVVSELHIKNKPTLGNESAVGGDVFFAVRTGAIWDKPRESLICVLHVQPSQ
jgi:hypothetical protein